MQDLHTLFAGQHVVVRDEPWLILGITAFGRLQLLRLRGVGTHNRGELRAVLTPFDRVQRIRTSRRLARGRRRAACAAAATAVAEAAPWDSPWTAPAATIDLRPWQMAPVRAVLGGCTRLLLADQVGLGKTIQAALIVAELLARGLAARVLVLTPAALRVQWADELQQRFGLAAAVYDQAAVLAAAAALPAGVNPWRCRPLIVSSIDLVKRAEVRAAVDEAPIDVLVVDEAHHLSPGSDRAAVVSALAARTPWLVLVTGTPHGGDDAAFEFLLKLGSADGEHMPVFRRSARTVHPRRPARSTRLRVRSSAAERALLDATRAYLRSVRRATSPASGATLVAAVIARRAAASPRAALATLERRRARLSGHPYETPAPLLPWEDDDPGDDTPDDQRIGMPAFGDRRREVLWLERLCDLARAAAKAPHKLRVLRRMVARTAEPVLIFSEFRDVACEVAAAVADLGAAAVLHGGLPARERHEAIARFTCGDVRILVATDAAGEGLNLQARCRWVINLELPWTPRRLEQRIGRLDRFGQTRRVHAVHLVHRHSYEATVLVRLERRRRRAEAASFPAAAGAADDALPSPPQVRHLQALAGPGREDGHARAVYAPEPPRHAAGRLVTMIFRITCQDAAGRVVQRPVVALTVERQPSEGRALTRRALRTMIASPAMQARLGHEAGAAAAKATAAAAPFADALARRALELRTCVESAWRTERWQPSLFDDRAAHVQAARRARLERTSDHLRDVHEMAVQLRRVSASAAELVAAWLGEP